MRTCQIDAENDHLWRQKRPPSAVSHHLPAVMLAPVQQSFPWIPPATETTSENGSLLQSRLGALAFRLAWRTYKMPLLSNFRV
jgi:hypothetical protein